MNTPFKQANRLGRLTTAFRLEVLSPTRFNGNDYLNDLFEYRVEAFATYGDLGFEEMGDGRHPCRRGGSCCFLSADVMHAA